MSSSSSTGFLLQRIDFISQLQLFLNKNTKLNNAPVQLETVVQYFNRIVGGGRTLISSFMPSSHMLKRHVNDV